MKREEFSLIVKGLKAVFAQPTFIPDQNAFNVWYELLKDLDYESAYMSAQRYMTTNKFPPTITDIRENAIVKNINTLNEMTAWNLVYKAICDANYHAKERYDEFPELIKKCIHGPAELKEMAQMDLATINSVTQSNFMRTFRGVQSREQEIDKIPNSVMAMIQKKKNEQLEENNNKLIGG